MLISGCTGSVLQPFPRKNAHRATCATAVSAVPLLEDGLRWGTAEREPPLSGGDHDPQGRAQVASLLRRACPLEGVGQESSQRDVDREAGRT